MTGPVTYFIRNTPDHRLGSLCGRSQVIACLGLPLRLIRDSSLALAVVLIPSWTFSFNQRPKLTPVALSSRHRGEHGCWTTVNRVALCVLRWRVESDESMRSPSR